MTLRTAACNVHTLHAKAPDSAGAFSVNKVAVTVAALMGVSYVITIYDDGSVGFHWDYSSKYTVNDIATAEPAIAFENSPIPFAAVAGIFSSAPGFATHRKVARWLPANRPR